MAGEQLLDPVEASSRILSACEDRLPPLSTHELAQILASWELLDYGGAVVMRCGPEIHAAAPAGVRGRWITRKGLDEVLGESIRRYGFARTSVMTDNAAGHAFVRRLGFQVVGQDGDATVYELRELRHAH